MRKRIRRSLSILAVIMFGLAIAVLVLELGLRFYFQTWGTEEQRVLYVYTREEINQRASRFAGKPYIIYGLNNAFAGHNELGYRGETIAVPKPPQQFRIVTIGGSTTYGVGIENDNETYPAQLETILQTDYGYEDVEVINAGVPAYTTWESTVNLIFRVLDLEPDMLIIYHAVNDVNPRIGDPAFYDGLNSGRGSYAPDQTPLPVSTLYRFIATRLGWQFQVDALDNKFNPPEQFISCGLEIQEGVAYCRNLDQSVVDVLSQNPPIYFERNIETMIQVAQARGITVMLSTWAYSPIEFDVVGGDFMSIPFRQQAVAEHNEIIRALAQEHDVPLYDLAQSMPTEPRYWIEGLHVNALGAREQAALYANFIDEQGLIAASP